MEAAPGRHSRGPLIDALVVGRYVWNHPANRGHRLSTLLQAIRFQARGRMLRAPTLVRCGRRSRLELWPGEGASGLAYANPPDLPEVAVWARQLRAGDLFVDVGANVGAYTIWALEAGAEVIALEPDPLAARRLRRNLEVNGYTATVLEAAASDAAGDAMLSEGFGVLNHLREDGTGRRVRAVTLDEVLGDRIAAGVKIDVEGAEDRVLAGAQRALSQRRIRLLQLEWNPQSARNFGAEREDAASRLRGFGYELLRPDARGVLHPISHDGAGPDVFARATSDPQPGAG